jgi:hypothetical protein
LEVLKKLDRSNLKSIDRILPEVDQSNIKSIDRNFSELTFAEAHQNTQSGASPWQKAVLPLIFVAEHAGFVTLVVSSKRGTLEGVRGVILHGFLA